jgi:zinc-ribbon domain
MTTLPVAHCANCQRELQPGWKFCIACGAPAPAPASEASANAVPVEPAVLAEPAAPGPPEIPAAIRPRAEKLAAAHSVANGEEPQRRINLAVLTSIVLGASGLALIIYLLVVVFGSRD